MSIKVYQSLLSYWKIARDKNLKVKKNMLAGGWNIETPNGSTYHARGTKELVEYIKDY